MVVEIKIVVVVMLGLLIGGSGAYIVAPDAEDDASKDIKTPVSSVLPPTGQYTQFYIMTRGGFEADVNLNAEVPEGAPARALDANAQVKDDDGIEIHWVGEDGPKGSGVAYYDVQYRLGEDGEWTLWKSETTTHSGMFYPTEQGTYYFRCRATDNAGNVEDFPDEPDTQFTVVDVDVKGDVVNHPIPDKDDLPTNHIMPYPYYPCPPGMYCANDEEQ